jgi:uncharacterized membrane protein YfcA
MNELFGILILLFIVAFFYSSVGHGGASGYIAVLSILGISATIIKPSALLLNVFVAGIAFYQYYRNGHFRWKLFYPFAILSMPMAYLGSFIELDPTWYKRILGVCLLIAALRIIGAFNRKETVSTKELPLLAGILIGAVLGFISGMIGIGGGILLSPIILLFYWGNLKETSAVSALFIVVNSIAGMIGLWQQNIVWPAQIYLWLGVAIAGGFLGAYWGSKRATNITLKNVLASVLFLAALKLIFI